MSNDDLLIDYLKRMQSNNPTFFYAIQQESSSSSSSSTATDKTKNIFWADPTFRMNYTYFGDTVTLHTTTLPFVYITGINHHAQPLLFGCGLLHSHSHSPASYIWLLHNWLHAMSPNNPPISITTQLDHHIHIAVQQVLPHTRHRFCKSSIFRQTVQKTPPSFHNEFRRCLHEAMSVRDFESCWQTLVQSYSLLDNEWLRSIYNARHQWLPAYIRQTFFGQLLPQEEEDEEDTFFFFFNGYVNSTTSIQSLVETAVTNWQEMEVNADFETATTMPVLKTPSPMEKQAANLYTRRAFLKFQEELVETLAYQATKLDDDDDDDDDGEEEDDSCVTTTYRVAKFGDDEQQEEEKAHIVRFNSLEMKAICNCHMFEFSGIICRHALSVFRAQNVLTLPSQYILKRWTRDAKRGGEYVPQLLLTGSNSQDSLTVRYNNLRHGALKFVEEGSKSVHIYNTALNALQVAAMKVAVSKKRVNHHSAVSNGENQDLDLDKASQQPSYQSKGEKEKKIQELMSELDNTNQRCEVYRANLLAVLRDMEEQKLKLSVKVQNARLSLKE